MTKPYVYVAGPYSNGDTMENVRNAVIAGERLWSIGCVPFIPHLNYAWHLLYPHDHRTWMTFDNAWLQKCDALLRLPGDSPGAEEEVHAALEMAIPVFFNIEQVAAWLSVVT